MSDLPEDLQFVFNTALYYFVNRLRAVPPPTIMKYTMRLRLVSLTIFLSLTTSIKAMAIQVCTDDQYTRVLHNGSIMCVDCFRCPDGLGPSIECGSKIKAGAKLDCQICKAGFNFSSSNDYEQCQTCGICSKDQVSKPCTTTRDTVCEKKCISKWNYYEESSDDCQECSYCCGDGKDTVIKECRDKGMPAHKSCTVHRRKKCTPAATTTTTVSPTTGHPTTSTTEKATKYENNSREWSKRKPKNHTMSSKHNDRSSSKSSFVIEGQVFIGVSCGLSFLVVGLLIFWFISCRKKSSKESQPIPKIIYTIKGETELFKLLKENHELMEQICKKLDFKNSFIRVARYFKSTDEDSLRIMETNPGPEPTKDVLYALEGVQPHLLVSDFAACLEKISRNDVLKCIMEKLKAQSSREIHVPINS